MSQIHETTRIRIAAPDGPSAFMLERHLRHLSPVTIGSDDEWTVELEDTEDRLEEIEAAVRHWLRESSLTSTTITVDGTPYPVTTGVAA
jgi:hypothetical protein